MNEWFLARRRVFQQIQINFVLNNIIIIIIIVIVCVIFTNAQDDKIYTAGRSLRTLSLSVVQFFLT